MNTPLFVLRCIQVGLSLSDLDILDFGFVMDIITEFGNDDFTYKEIASQEDFDSF